LLAAIAQDREAAEKDQLKARHRWGKFLLRHGRMPDGVKASTKRSLDWS
jgi:hypothetical protein